MSGTEECNECGGYGYSGTEEDTGCPFACYRCGTTGRVPMGTHAAELAEQRQYMAQQAGYDTVAEYDASVLVAQAAAEQRHQERLALAKVRAPIYDDDLPF